MDAVSGNTKPEMDPATGPGRREFVGSCASDRLAGSADILSAVRDHELAAGKMPALQPTALQREKRLTVERTLLQERLISIVSVSATPDSGCRRLRCRSVCLRRNQPGVARGAGVHPSSRTH